MKLAILLLACSSAFAQQPGASPREALDPRTYAELSGSTISVDLKQIQQDQHALALEQMRLLSNEGRIGQKLDDQAATIQELKIAIAGLNEFLHSPTALSQGAQAADAAMDKRLSAIEKTVGDASAAIDRIAWAFGTIIIGYIAKWLGAHLPIPSVKAAPRVELAALTAGRGDVRREGSD